VHASIDGSIDDVLCADHVGLHELERIVFGGRNLLQSRGVDHGIDAVKGAHQAVAIAHVSQEEAQSWVARILALHLVLLELVAAEHHDARDRGVP
jgi:hypothetical protein